MKQDFVTVFKSNTIPRILMDASQTSIKLMQMAIQLTGEDKKTPQDIKDAAEKIKKTQADAEAQEKAKQEKEAAEKKAEEQKKKNDFIQKQKRLGIGLVVVSCCILTGWGVVKYSGTQPTKTKTTTMKHTIKTPDIIQDKAATAA